VDKIGIGMRMNCHLIIVINSSRAKNKTKTNGQAKQTKKKKRVTKQEELEKVLGLCFSFIRVRKQDVTGPMMQEKMKHFASILGG
jgi:hypothetical protein